MKPLVSIQYLRALAALAVVAFHSGRATILGQAGVDVFFVISGFIMWMVTAKPIGPAEFLWHRVLRIVPLYWIATLVMATLRGSSAHDTILSLLFWPHRDPDGQVWPVLIQGWTLNYEMFFYLMFAASLLVRRRLRLLVLTAVLCGLAAIGLAVQPHGTALYTYTNPLLLEFLAGAWLCALVQSRRAPGIPAALGMLGVGLIGFLMSLHGSTPQISRVLIWGIPSLLVVAGAVAIELRRGMPAIKPLKLLGDGSYSIYLFHPFLLKTVEMPLVRFAPVPVAVVTVTGAAVGMAVFYLVEKPVTAWLRRLITRALVLPIVERV